METECQIESKGFDFLGFLRQLNEYQIKRDYGLSGLLAIKEEWEFEQEEAAGNA